MYTKAHDKTFAYLEGKPRIFLEAASILLAVILCYLDFITGPYTFLIFYVIPVFLSAWFVDKSFGIAAALACVSASIIANITAREPVHLNVWYFFWDTIAGSSYLVLLSLMFSTLKEKLDREKLLAHLDPLTGALNRARFYELAAYEIEKSRRYGRPFTIAYLDIDNFKLVNDRFGHPVGDEVLRAFAGSVRENARTTDLLTRMGGDEFVILFPETGAEGAGIALRNIHRKFLTRMENKNWDVTFSVGSITYNTPPGSVEEMIKKADDLMYAAKKSGRNATRHQVVEALAV
jgi:diguanylate cyclase (GGDEF)-like protein